jgi:hypothetical protein
MSKRLWFTRRTIAALFITAIAACTGRSCGDFGCRHAETCDECVQRCVQTQGGSPDLCRGAACSSICNK